MLPDRTERLNVAASQAVIDACVRSGVDHFFVAPGSRSTPLTLALARRTDVVITRHFDERGLAFAALGYARASGRTGAIVCTSGTAVANLMPAVVEASLDHVPMLVLSADRPPELRDFGHNQTIDQVRLFGTATRWFADLPCPSEDVPLAFWSRTIAHAVARSSDGPVHLNMMIREPFGHPDDAADDAADAAVIPTITAAVANPIHPWTIPAGPTLVVAGGCSRDEALAARRLADRLSSPLLSDISNGVRGDLTPPMLADDSLPSPDVVIHVGQRVVSKRYPAFLRSRAPRHVIHLTRFSDRHDPALAVTEIRQGDLVGLCDAAVAAAGGHDGLRRPWLTKAAAARQRIERVLSGEPRLSEPGAAWDLARQLPDGSALFLGNSLTIREWDCFAHWPVSQTVFTGANRGASGIDGLVATAVGFALGHHRPTTAVVGDLSALHDLNSLALMASSPVPVMLVVVNNDGGGIFQFLPVAATAPHFEPFFLMPHGRTFGEAARMFGLDHHPVSDRASLRSAYAAAIAAGRSCVIELSLDGRETRPLHEQLEAEILHAMEATV